MLITFHADEANFDFSGYVHRLQPTALIALFCLILVLMNPELKRLQTTLPHSFFGQLSVSASPI